MATPFQLHKQRVLAEQKAASQRESYERSEPAAIDATATDYSAFEVLKFSLEQDVTTSKNVPRGQERERLITETLLPRYEAHIAAYIENGEAYANAVLVQVIIWLFDTGRIERALPLAFLAVEQGQKMHPDYKRDLPTFVVDTVREWAEQETRHGRSVEPWFTQIFEKIEEWPLPDATKMRAYKLAGKLAFESEEFEAAVGLLTKADELSTSSYPAQVTTLLAQAKKKLDACVKKG